MMAAQDTPLKPLSGIRVLAISHHLAGPYGSMLLGDLGAEVIKIESPEGEPSRTFAGPNHKGQSFFFLAFNRNKKSLTLDLGTPAGKKAFYDLVKVSDVVWNNFRPGALARLGADYKTIKAINPKIVYCSISGYGPTGPYAKRPSFDITALALSGIMSLTGEPDGPPLKPGAPIADLAAGMLGALGVCAALTQRERTGVGQEVDVSLLDACISMLSYEFSYYFLSGIMPRALGSGHLSLVPYNAYQTKEGYLVIGPSWPRLARVLGLEWMIDDPRFADLNARNKNRKEFNRIIQEALLKEKAEDWLEIMHAEDIAAAPVNTLDQTMVDPQVSHRKMIVDVDFPGGGSGKLIGNPVKLTNQPDEKYQPPPAIGQHKREILMGLLGYSEDRLREMEAEEKAHAAELKEHLHKRL
jgi:crotonobetainyl-CoA:carnitine CoA-transferase CaiB-like acyl-CoA transferase